MPELAEKKQALLRRLQGLGKAAVAFSGGVDSAVLAAAAWRVLPGRTIAVTAYSELFPRSERAGARMVAEEIGIPQVEIASEDLLDPELVANDRERCYYCKRGRLRKMEDWAMAQGYPWILDGSNADDRQDHRPGAKALVESRLVLSPLQELGFTKQDIRDLAREWGLSVADKPSSACLASRIALGLPLTKERLRQVEQAEEAVRRVVAGQMRVRYHHGGLARIEVSPEAVAQLVQPRTATMLSAALREIGFSYVTVDLTGYRMGSLNELKGGVAHGSD